MSNNTQAQLILIKARKIQKAYEEVLRLEKEFRVLMLGPDEASAGVMEKATVDCFLEDTVGISPNPPVTIEDAQCLREDMLNLNENWTVTVGPQNYGGVS